LEPANNCPIGKPIANKNSKARAKRKRKREESKVNEAHARKKTALAAAIHNELPLRSVPVSTDMITTSGIGGTQPRPTTLSLVRDSGFTVIEWDGM